MRRRCQLDLCWWSFHNTDKSQLSSPCRPEIDTTSYVNLISTEIFKFQRRRRGTVSITHSNTDLLGKWSGAEPQGTNWPWALILARRKSREKPKILAIWSPCPTSWHGAVRLQNAISPGLMLCLSTQQLLQHTAWWLAEGEWGAVRPMSCLILYPRRHTLWGQRDWCSWKRLNSGYLGSSTWHTLNIISLGKREWIPC